MDSVDREEVAPLFAPRVNVVGWQKQGRCSPPHSHHGHWKSVSPWRIFIASFLVRDGSNARQNEWKEEGGLENSLAVMGTSI